jgi:hypothetical protein
MKTTSLRPLGPSSRVPALILLTALFAAACGANLSPVLNLNHVPVGGTPPGVEPTTYVHDAILRGIRARGWTVAKEAPGVISASIQKDAYSATVDIPYTATDYSIVHRESSPGLKFDGTRIHKRYNVWIDRLRASINQEISGPTPHAPAPAAPATGA